MQGPDGDEITFAGQRGVFNNISLDGGDFNNGFFGEQAGGQRAPIDITLDAVKEFQVIASGAPAEFGRTAGGVVNVITKSGANDRHGTVFHFQRLEGLTGDLSDGTKLEDFHREQFGGTIGGPIRRDKAFFFVAVEGITGDFQRPNLGRAIGTPCPVAAPTLAAERGAHQRVARLPARWRSSTSSRRGSARTKGSRSTTRSRPFAMLLKADANVGAASRLSASYNFNHSRKENETFDVATYGSSANGTEGDPARINVAERELVHDAREQQAERVALHLLARDAPAHGERVEPDAPTPGIGFAPSFRFGNPFFLQPNVDELIWRTQIKDNLSIVRGGHTWKMGGEWMHTLNDQVFRGFFTGRYLFDSVDGLPALRVAGGAGRIRARRRSAARTASYVTLPASCPAGTTPTGGPLLFYLQGAGRTGLATDAAGASRVANEELSLFIQDQWQVRSNVTLQYGLRWDAQLMPETVDPADDGVRAVPRAIRGSRPTARFPISGRCGSRASARRGTCAATDARCCAASAGVYFARQNMLSQVGSVTTNGLQQQTHLRQHRQRAAVRRDAAGLAGRADAGAAAGRAVPAVHRRPRLPPRLREPAHVHVQRRLRAGARRRTWPATPTTPTRAAATSRGSSTTTAPDAGQPVQPAARRGDGDDQPRQVGLSRPDARAPEALLARAISSRRTTCSRATKTTTRTSAIRSPIALQLLRPVARLRALGSRHPAQGQLLRLLRSCPAAFS